MEDIVNPHPSRGRLPARLREPLQTSASSAPDVKRAIFYCRLVVCRRRLSSALLLRLFMGKWGHCFLGDVLSSSYMHMSISLGITGSGVKM